MSELWWEAMDRAGIGPDEDEPMTATPRQHPVYPGGPDCQPNCPGEWSMYHDGYADGYENAVNAHDALLAALRALVAVCPHDMPHPGSVACMKCDALKEAGRLLRDLSREGEGQ